MGHVGHGSLIGSWVKWVTIVSSDLQRVNNNVVSFLYNTRDNKHTLLARKKYILSSYS